jgi:hypothetical protein
LRASPFIISTVVKSLQNTKRSFRPKNNKPSLLARACYFTLTILLLLSGCGSFTLPMYHSDKSDLTNQSNSEMSMEDYADHLASLKRPFLSTPGIKKVLVNKSNLKYLQDMLEHILGNNEIFFKSLKSGNVTILDLEAPLHFSLPKGEIFLSKGLVAKYIKHESMLVCILAYELVRSEKLLYPKETIIPIGYVPLERIITLNRLSSDEKMEVHKWAYHLTFRSGHDGEYYLSWLQIQNRNTADFIMQVGDANQINREESLFKAFLIKQSEEEKIVKNKNSSKAFYSLLNSIRDGAI